MEPIADELAKHAGLFEMKKVTTYRGFRTLPDGSVREVTVEVGDTERDEPYRYTVKAVDEDGRTATGNGGTSVEHAILTTHWQELDGEPRVY